MQGEGKERGGGGGGERGCGATCMRSAGASRSLRKTCFFARSPSLNPPPFLPLPDPFPLSRRPLRPSLPFAVHLPLHRAYLLPPHHPLHRLCAAAVASRTEKMNTSHATGAGGGGPGGVGYLGMEWIGGGSERRRERR